MRKYPKKCPKCGEDMEPVFEEGLGYRAHNIPNINQQPIFWKCIYCGHTTEKRKG